VKVWITSDSDRRQEVTLTVCLRSLNGAKPWEESRAVSIPPNSSRSVFLIDESIRKGLDPTKHYLQAMIVMDGRPVSENRFFFVEPKHLQLPRSKVTFSLTSVSNTELELVLRAGKFVKNVRVETKGEDVALSDNYIDIDAGGTRIIRLSTERKPAEVRERIRLYWLEKGRQ